MDGREISTDYCEMKFVPTKSNEETSKVGGISIRYPNLVATQKKDSSRKAMKLCVVNISRVRFIFSNFPSNLIGRIFIHRQGKELHCGN